MIYGEHGVLDRVFMSGDSGSYIHPSIEILSRWLFSLCI
jgi:hypothetical protein